MQIPESLASSVEQTVMELTKCHYWDIHGFGNHLAKDLVVFVLFSVFHQSQRSISKKYQFPYGYIPTRCQTLLVDATKLVEVLKVKFQQKQVA